MYAYMSSKIHNYTELISFTEECKKIKPIQIEIIDFVELQDEELYDFLTDFKMDQKWIEMYLKEMSIVNKGVWKCILVVSEELEIPIVVYSNMCLYSQYVGILQ